MGPQVESLAQSMAMLSGGFDEQKGLINEQIGGLNALYGSKAQALEGTRVKAFNTINDQAAGRGASFSGIPLGEQADYLADKFLPGMVGLQEQENSERMQYRQNIAQLNTQQQTAALSRVDQQQAALNSWNLQQAQMDAQRKEAELQRQFTASQNAMDRSASAAASRSSEAAPTAAQAMSDLFATNIASGADWKKDGTTERIIQTLRAQYGAAAVNQLDVYGYRKNELGY